MVRFDPKAFASGKSYGDPIEQGNIDLNNRPRVTNPDGSVSTVRSLGVNIDGKEVLIPTVSDEGTILSNEDAIDRYKKTGRHLGKFNSPEESTAYAKRLHGDQERLINQSSGFNPKAFASGQDSSQIENEPSLLKDIGNSAIDAVGTAGEYLDRYGAAPTRSAIRAAQKGENPITAFGKQFGAQSADAPHFKEIAEAAGVTHRNIGEFAPNPRARAMFGPLADVPVSSAVGVIGDVAVDPLNFVPVGKIAKGASKLFEATKIPGALAKAAEGFAFKAGGATLRDIKNALKRGTLAKQGRVALETGLVKKFDTAEDIASKASDLRKIKGEEIGSIHREITGRMKSPEFLNKLTPQEIEAINSTRIIPDNLANELKSELRNKFTGRAGSTNAIGRGDTLIDEVLKGENEIDLGTSNAIKSDIDRSVINYEKTPGQKEDITSEAYKYIRDRIQNKIENQISALDKIAGKDKVKQLRSANKEFGTAKQFEKMASDREARHLANRFMSLTDYLAGGIGSMQGGPGDDYSDRIVKGLVFGAANRLLRTRGASTAASVLDSLSKARPPTEALINSARGARAISTQTEQKKRKRALGE